MAHQHHHVISNLFQGLGNRTVHDYWLCALCGNWNQVLALKCEYCTDQEIYGVRARLLTLQPKQDGLSFVVFSFPITFCLCFRFFCYNYNTIACTISNDS